MKYLLNFDTVAEYNNVKDTLEKPYVITIDENNGLQYNTDVIRVPEGSCDGGGSDIEYLDVSGVDYMVAGQIPIKSLLGTMAYSTKFVNPNNDALIILGCATLYTSFSIDTIQSLDYIAVEIDFNGTYAGNSSDGIMTFKDALLQMGVPKAEIDAIPRITKEEFYSFETA